MSDAITGISAVESTQTAKSSSFLQPVIDTVQQHENRLQGTIRNGLSGDISHKQFRDFLDTTFQRLQTKYTSPIEQQTFKLVREQALASQAANAEHVRDRIRSKLKNIQVELSVKAAGKTSQGLQQLLSSQ